MLSLICSGESIAFVGAGLGVRLNYPTWDDLLQELNDEANKLSPLDLPPEILADPLKRADAIKEHFVTHHREPIYHELLGRRFGPRTGANCTATHRLLVGLPFRAFATTNYESSLESALLSTTNGACPDHGVIVKMNGADCHRVSTFLRSLTDPSSGFRYIAHLHGRHDDTKNMILTATDYEMAYGVESVNGATITAAQVTLHRKLTWALFATRQMIFVGCSMRDPYIKALLAAVGRDLWEVSEKNHFIIQGLEAKDIKSAESDAEALGRHGLRVVYYDNFDGTHRTRPTSERGGR